MSFLGDSGEVKAIAVDGETPAHTNSAYPLTRPLYLLWWRGRNRVADFVPWTSSDEAEAILLRRFTKAAPIGDGAR